MKKTIYIILILLTIISILFCNFSYADSDVLTDLGGENNLSNYAKADSEGSTQVISKAGTILGYITTIGMVLSIIILIIIGIKYMVGSVEEKANYKETLKPYLIGAILLFTGTLIPSLIYNIVEQII